MISRDLQGSAPLSAVRGTRAAAAEPADRQGDSAATGGPRGPDVFFRVISRDLQGSAPWSAGLGTRAVAAELADRQGESAATGGPQGPVAQRGKRIDAAHWLRSLPHARPWP